MDAGNALSYSLAEPRIIIRGKGLSLALLLFLEVVNFKIAKSRITHLPENALLFHLAPHSIDNDLA